MDTGLDRFRLLLATVVIGLALFAIVAIFSVTNNARDNDAQFKNSATIAGTAIAAISGLAGLLIGNATGAAGKEKAEERAKTAEQKATAIAGEASNDVVDAAARKYPELFGLNRPPQR
jgi:hypothetical protein